MLQRAMNKWKRLCANFLLAITGLGCVTVIWAAFRMVNFGPWPFTRAFIFVAIFGGVFVLCAWGILSSFRPTFPENSRKRIKIVLTACCVGVASYVISYVVMSSQGGYGPFDAGTNGIKSFAWYPQGYINDSGRCRMPVFYIFIPLWNLDMQFWHRDWTGATGPYIKSYSDDHTYSGPHIGGWQQLK